jgi:hypothetical protein
MAENTLPDAKDFSGASFTLDAPSHAIVERTYYALPQRGNVVVSCRFEGAGEILRALEATGFFGMRLRRGADATEITAYKGKEGACYDTGRTALYTGAAAGVLDDDNHFLVGQLRVCEKTAGVYSSPAYAGMIDVTEADPSLLAQLQNDPKPFDCDTFAEDAARLASTLVRADPAKGPAAALMYPGPFRLIVLGDGRILRRGRAAAVDAKTAQSLAESDGCIALEDAPAANALANFIDEYERAGPVFILAEETASAVSRGIAGRRMEALLDAPRATVERLTKMIDRRDPYFLLTGSDPSVPGGCCPSDDVGVADALVRAGVLEAWRPPMPPDACPTTTYAFAGEILAEGGRPTFRFNETLRRRVRETIAGAR